MPGAVGLRKPAVEGAGLRKPAVEAPGTKVVGPGAVAVQGEARARPGLVETPGVVAGQPVGLWGA